MMSTKHKYEKKNNVINRTTSETLRLGEAELRMMAPSSQTARKKIQSSSSSFQITGVSMTRTDGDDSADDLDTDDISRVTDNETPSFSEDSRDTDDHQLEAPVEFPQAEVKSKPLPPDERFKIVKMPSTATRGRWVCVDYFDDAPDRGFKRMEYAIRPALVQQVYASPHYTNLQPNFHDVATKPAGLMKGLPQGYSSILTNEGSEPVNFGSRQNISHLNQKSATQPSRENGQKFQDDILSDIKVALTSMPASNSGSAPNNNNIDRKIEEALDAVKTHLMVAVHKEVDFLKTRVSTLEGRVNELEIENSILRVNYLLFKS